MIAIEYSIFVVSTVLLITEFIGAIVGEEHGQN